MAHREGFCQANQKNESALWISMQFSFKNLLLSVVDPSEGNILWEILDRPAKRTFLDMIHDFNKSVNF